MLVAVLGKLLDFFLVVVHLGIFCAKWTQVFTLCFPPLGQASATLWALTAASASAETIEGHSLAILFIQANVYKV